MAQEVKEAVITEYPKAAKIPWLLLVVVLVLSISIGVAWNTLIPSSIWVFYNPGSVDCAEEFAVLPFIMILLSIPIYKLANRKIGGETLTYLYVIAIFGSYTSLGYGAFRLPAGLIAQRWLNPETISPLIPEIMAPPRAIAEQLINGGVPIPWGNWLPVIIYYWLLLSFFEFYMLSIGTIWSRQWIQVEQIPFPQTLAVHEIYEQASTKKSLKPYFLGIALGFIFQFIVYLIMVFPWFPDIYGWRVNTNCYGASWIDNTSPLYGIVALAQYSKNPSLAALFYMAPLNTLLTSVICNIFLFVATQVAYSAGYYTDLMNMPGCGRAECGTSSLRWGAPFKWVVVTNIGGGLGIVLMYLFLQRRYLANAFKSILGGAEAEDQKVTRMAFMVTFASYFMVVALLIVAGLGPASALLMPVMVWVLFFAAMFVYGRTGYNALGFGTYGLYWLRIIWPQLPERTDTNFALTAILARQPGSDDLGQGWGGSLAASFASYKFANLTKTSFRNVYYVMLFAAILMPPIWWLTLLSIGYSQGMANMPFYSSTTFVGDISYAANPASTWSGTSPEVTSGGPWIPNMVAGILIVWTLTLLHARYPGFPLDPYGFLMTFTARAFSEGIWVMITIAWILKIVTLRIGGSKAYERLGLPVATGFLLGYALAILLGGVISAIRFFIPF